MTISDKLEIGIHYYRSRRYDEAIQFFSSLLKKNQAETSKSIAHLWLGKCYFEKPEIHAYTHHTPRISSKLKGRLGLEVSERISVRTVCTRKIQTALNYLNAAIKIDNSLAEAHYWKGKALQYKGQVESAYRSYINAARISEDRRYLGKCVSMYSNHEELPFLETRDISSISIEEAILALSSNEKYIRMEGCLALSQHLESGHEAVEQIKLGISALAGYKLLCCYVPWAGDSDARIKTYARFIIENDETAESSLSLISMHSQSSL